MKKISAIAITKNGIKIGLSLKELYPSCRIFAPIKFSYKDPKIEWYSASTSKKIAELFKTNDALICLFSLGAVIRLISPHIKDKKTDPAVLVIDDKANFVISALSGHLGGANELAEQIAKKLAATSVITTAADVNRTIPVDLVGKKFDWKIDDGSTVTKVSALMINGEKIGVYQDAGDKNWWMSDLPKNVTMYSSFDELKNSGSKGFLIISDKIIESEILKDAVVYRPLNLVVGVGLHWDTSKETIREGLQACLKKNKLSQLSIAKFASLKKPHDAKGLIEISREMNIPIEYFEKEDLANVDVPNPSQIVQAFEGTPSISEASAIKASRGQLIVQKQKFPPNLNIAIARIPN